MLQLAVLRYLLLPLYAKWWIAQTSSRIFAYLLFLYVMQMLNWTIYSYNVNRSHAKLNDSDTCDARDGGGGSISSSSSTKSSSTVANDFISITDLLVPMSLGLLLSLIHSQIVATASSNLITADKLNKCQFQQQRKRRERKKRRKSTRSRSASDATKSRINGNAGLCEDRSSGGDGDGDGGGAESFEINAQQESPFPSSGLYTSTVEKINAQQSSHHRRLSGQSLQQQQKINEVSDSNYSPPPASSLASTSLSSSSLHQRKRNVNWRSPIKSNYTVSSMMDMRNAIIVSSDVQEINGETAAHGDDDGFESLNGKSSSGEEMTIALSNSSSNNNNNNNCSSSNTSNNNVNDEPTARTTNNNKSSCSTSSSSNKQQQYVNSAYPMGTFGDNNDDADADDDVNNNSDDNDDLINGTNEMSENVSAKRIYLCDNTLEVH